MADPFRSSRLIYRALEPEDDEAFILTIQQDPVSFRNANANLAVPQSKKSAKDYIKWMTENTIIAVIMCLPPPEPAGKAIPIGCIHLGRQAPHLAQHRNADIGIEIVKPYQGQGYGSEAIRWILEWAFVTAGLHRVAIGAFECVLLQLQQIMTFC